MAVESAERGGAGRERRSRGAPPPQAGLVEMAAQYNVDSSIAKPGMRLADFAEEVKAQKGNLGSFEELLKTVDPQQSLKEFGHRFLVDRILVAVGTPKQIVDKLEELHEGTGANGGFILRRGFSAIGNLQDFVAPVVPELQPRGPSKTRYARPTLPENPNRRTPA